MSNKDSNISDIYVTLLHYPVVNRAGNVIISAITNLDIHDISRACKTYGIKNFFIVTPDKEQQEISKEIISYWIKGKGGELNPDRKEALKLVKIKSDLSSVKNEIFKKTDDLPLVIATSAGYKGQVISCRKLKENFLFNKENKRPLLLVFGTAFGLHKDIYTNEVDMVLESIKGPTAYNHLSVRCAVAIYLDRLLN